MIRLLLFGVLFSAVFFLFTYNSGYGYDAYEYLIIARSFDQGYSLYDFIPSKSFLTYASTNLLLKPLGGYNHVSVSLLITLLALGVLASAWRAGGVFGERAAQLTVAVTAVTCFFTEMNFLEPESWIAICGLNAFATLAQQPTKPTIQWLLAGIWLGLAMSFKSVGAFYAAAFGLYCVLLWLLGRQTIGQTIGRGLLLVVGFALPLVLAAGYFYVQGRLDLHIEWTYVYPLGGYPSHTLFLEKFIIKLGWFLALLLASLVLSALRPYRAAYTQTPLLWLTLLAGAFSCVALLKTQASHYFFPAAVFFALHIGFFAEQWLARRQGQGLPRRLVLGGAVAALLVVVSALLYRPNALRRFVTLADYSNDDYVARFIQKQVGPDQHALFIDHAMFLYYVSDREPNVPFITTEMQTTHYLKKHPNTYRKALADTSLKMVIFGNLPAVIDDSTTLNHPSNQRAVGQLKAGLQTYFKPVKTPDFPLTYYVRK